MHCLLLVGYEDIKYGNGDRHTHLHTIYSQYSGISSHSFGRSYFIFGSWLKSQLGSLVSGVKGLLCGWVPISRKKKRCSHRKRHTRAKAKYRILRWRRRALPFALVVRCRRRSSIPGSQNTRSMNILYRLFKNKAPCLASDISLPVHWKWKKKNVGLTSVIPELKLSTLQGFCAVDRDFLCLPQLLKTFLQS